MNVSGIGRLTKKPELNYSKDNKAFAYFTIASNEGYGDRKKTSFIDCTCFGKIAENICKYTDKGSQVFVTGILDQNMWISKDGSKRTAIKILCSNIQFLDSKKENDSGEQKDGTSKYNDYRAVENPWGNNDKIPF